MCKVAPISQMLQMQSSFLGSFWEGQSPCNLWLIMMSKIQMPNLQYKQYCFFLYILDPFSFLQTAGMVSEPSDTPSSTWREAVESGRTGVESSSRASVSPFWLCFDEWLLPVRILGQVHCSNVAFYVSYQSCFLFLLLCSSFKHLLWRATIHFHQWETSIFDVIRLPQV